MCFESGTHVGGVFDRDAHLKLVAQGYATDRYRIIEGNVEQNVYLTFDDVVPWISMMFLK